MQRKLANHTEVPKMPLRKSYDGRTYRCLKKVIKKRQEERKKKAESLLLRKNYTKYDKFIKLAFIERRKFTKYNFIASKKKGLGQPSEQREGSPVQRRLLGSRSPGACGLSA